VYHILSLFGSILSKIFHIEKGKWEKKKCKKKTGKFKMENEKRNMENKK
jgi:hypothetical protein